MAKTERYIHWKADGSYAIIESQGALGLKKLQELVGGYIEVVDLRGPSCPGVMVNEEGRNIDLPVNPHIRQSMTWVELFEGLRGDAVEGRTTAAGAFLGVSQKYGSAVQPGVGIPAKH